ncbi:MAG: HAD family phosphatase [Maribacter sp.]|nr:HAD family phosphatase [Maribacter sp.]
MKYKILCTDLDGTLLSTKSDVSDVTISEISRIKQYLKVILVSARMPKAMRYLQERLGILDNPIICYNGALILDRLNCIFSIELPIDIVQSVNQLAIANGVKLGLYHRDEWYTSHNTECIQKEINYTRAFPILRPIKETISEWKMRNIGAHKLMLMGEKEALDSMAISFSEQFDSRLVWYRSSNTILEVTPIGTSKLLGIKKIINKNQSLSDVIAFGDNYNDIEMLQGVGCGVAVGNARQEVKAIADQITLDNTDDGVAHFISNYIVI